MPRKRKSPVKGIYLSICEICLGNFLEKAYLAVFWNEWSSHNKIIQKRMEDLNLMKSKKSAISLCIKKNKNAVIEF